MAPMFEVPLVATQEAITQHAYVHVYDEKNAVSEKPPIDERTCSSLDVEVVALDGDDIIRESGMSL